MHVLTNSVLLNLLRVWLVLAGVGRETPVQVQLQRLRVAAVRVGAGEATGGVPGADEDPGRAAGLLLRLPRLLRHPQGSQLLPGQGQ